MIIGEDLESVSIPTQLSPFSPDALKKHLPDNVMLTFVQSVQVLMFFQIIPSPFPVVGQYSVCPQDADSKLLTHNTKIHTIITKETIPPTHTV